MMKYDFATEHAAYVSGQIGDSGIDYSRAGPSGGGGIGDGVSVGLAEKAIVLTLSLAIARPAIAMQKNKNNLAEKKLAETPIVVRRFIDDDGEVE